MKLEHIISTKQFLDPGSLENLFRTAEEMKSEPQQTAKNKILAALFYEPSTRTRFSFESAMHRLGGSVITTESAGLFSSVTKGETLEDTIRIVSGYADVIVLRHSEEGSAEIASRVSSVPLVNAGDGPGEHPTQALLDLYTIQDEMKRIDGLSVSLIGDLRFGRTVHSLLNLLSLYSNVTIHLVSPKLLRLPEMYIYELKAKNITFVEHESLEGVIEEIDVFYTTRVQKERFEDEKEYEQVKDSFIIDKDTLKSMKSDAIILHPLPRVTEISSQVDDDPRAAYFRQAKNGLYIRMALLKMLLK